MALCGVALNTSKKAWHMPWDDKNKFETSFTDMFEKSVADGEKMIKALYQYLNAEISIDELLLITGNFSFTTGLNFDEEVDFKFHDIVYQS